MVERNKYRKLRRDPNIRYWREHAPLISRFMSKFDKGDGCWEWKSTLNPSGYGMFHVNEFGTDVPAHRVSFMIFRGEIPEGMDVCHHCDNPKCVNPTHFFTGTNLDNINDARTKGRLKLRGHKGHLHPRSKLLPSDIAYIRSFETLRGVRKGLAEKYGLCTSTINKIFHGKTYE